MIGQFNVKKPRRGYETDLAKSKLMLVTKIHEFEP